MASGTYDGGREGFLDGSIDWDTDTIKAVLVDAADYTVDLATHRNLSDIPAGARVATSPALTGKTVTAGVLDAADYAFATVVGDQSEALVYYKDTGSAATSRLIAYVDTGTGLPITPSGADINVALDNGPNKILAWLPA